MALTFVQGNTAPNITSIIHAQGDVENVIDLSGCTVMFQMRKPDDRRFTVNAEAEILDADEGSVRYQWGPNDLAVHGEYVIQWQVIYPNDKRQTTADTETITVRRE